MTTQQRWRRRNLEQVRSADRERWARSSPEFRAARAARKRASWYIRPSARVINFAKRRPCADCGGRFESCQMQYDHRPDQEKLFQLGGANTRALNKVIDEIVKCDVVCANCHSLRTFIRRSA